MAIIFMRECFWSLKKVIPFRKGEYLIAVDEYRETIGVLEPSYVIRKFLGGSKVQVLCTYLEALRDKRLQNEHHMSELLPFCTSFLLLGMLMNCYTQMAAHESTQKEARAKIMGFIQKPPMGRCDAEAIFQVPIF